MSKKILNIIVIILMVFTLSGCGNSEKETTKTKKAVKKESSISKIDRNKHYNKTILCKPNEEADQSEIMIDSKIEINFENDIASTVYFVQNVKILSNDDYFQSKYKSYTSESLYNYYNQAMMDSGIDEPNIKADMVTKSKYEKEITLSFNYMEFMGIYLKGMCDSSVYSNTNFDYVYNNVIGILQSKENLVCTYNGNVIQ